MSIFLRSSMCFRVPHLCSKIPKIYNWSMDSGVHSVCFRGDFALRQWLDFYAKSRLNLWRTFKHFIHMQYFLLPTNLVIVFVHWVSTGVLYEPRQGSLFWDYIPESKFFFLPQSVPPAWCIFNPTNTDVAQLSTWRRAMGAPGIHPDGEQPKTALWLWVHEITWYLYTRGVRGRMKAKQRWYKVTRELCHEWVHHFRHYVHDCHWTGEFATVIWRLHCFTV